MSVQINVVGEFAADVIKELSVLGFHHAPVTAAAPAADQPKADKPSSRSRNTKPESEPEKKEEPVKQEPAPEPKDDEDEDDLLGGGDDEPIPTDVELRALVSELQAKVGSSAPEKEALRKAIKALLAKYNSANVTGVPDDKRIAFKRELEAL